MKRTWPLVLLCSCLRFSAQPLPNAAPSIALPDLVVSTGETVVIDATTAVDADGDAITFAWSQVEGQADPVSLTGADGPIVTFTAPDRGQRLFLKLTLSDGAASAEVFVRIRVNTAPVVRNGGVFSGKAPLAVAGDASDPDGDEIVEYRWSLIEAPIEPCVGCLGDEMTRVATVDGPTGTYRLSLVVSDGFAESQPAVFVVNLAAKNRAPVVGVYSTDVRVVEGNALPIDASGSFDLDGDAISVVWNKASGSEVWPAQLVGARPSLTAPAFAAVVEDNAATYVVSVSDGELSSAQEVIVRSLPGDGYIVLGDGPNADDTTLPLCGSAAKPCRTIERALQLVDPDNNLVGDGRDLILTSGTYSSYTTTVMSWRGGTSVIGSRDPVTFGPGTRSNWGHINGGCHNPVVGILLPQSVGNSTFFRDFDITYAPEGCINRNTAFECDRCGARFMNVRVVAAIPPIQGYTSYARGFWAHGAGTDLHIDDGDLEVGSGDVANVGFEVWSGAKVSIARTRMNLAATNTAGTNNPPDQAAATQNTCVFLNGGTVDAEAFVCKVSGPVTSAPVPPAGFVSQGGVLTAKNSVVQMAAGSAAIGIRLLGGGGATSLLHLTVTGNGATGVESAAGFSLMNSLVQGFALGLDFSAAPALDSAIFGNVVSGSASALDCNGTQSSEVNASTGSTCNQSANAWAQNSVGTCGFALAGDFHLNPTNASACLHAAMSTSPAGLAPDVDIDGDARVAPNIDVGADQVP